MMWKKMRQKLDLPESYISITLGFLVILVAGILTYNYFVKNRTMTPSEKVEKIMEEQKTADGKTVVSTLPTSYTVAKGDSLWSIAERHYKSGYNWVTIVKANNLMNPNKIEEGQKLSLPKADPIKPEGQILATQAPPKEYAVVKGDSLWKISEREYGTGYSWTKISNYNKIANPNVIQPGLVLKLPR